MCFLTATSEREIRIDLKTYNSLASTHYYAETQYEYEEAENEKKRRIKILDRRYANRHKRTIPT